MILERKTVKFEVKSIDEEEGTFVGYAATFSDHPDSYGEIIDPGAFKKTIKERKRQIKILWNHDVYEPIGKPSELTEDDTGLLIHGKLTLGVQRAKEVLALMKDGVINELSIGFNVIKEKTVENIRHLQEIKLYDTSPVSFAANTEAVIASVKTDEGKPDKEHGESFEAAEKQSKAGRVLSTANMEKVKAALEAMQKGLEQLQALLEAADKEPEPAKATLLSKAEQEAAELEQTIAILKAENEGVDTKEAEKRIEAMLDKMPK